MKTFCKQRFNISKSDWDKINGSVNLLNFEYTANYPANNPCKMNKQIHRFQWKSAKNIKNLLAAGNEYV